MDSKIDRSHIQQQWQTTIGINHLARMMHECCRALACSFARNESLLPQGTLSAQAHSPCQTSVSMATNVFARIRCNKGPAHKKAG